MITALAMAAELLDSKPDTSPKTPISLYPSRAPK